MKLNFWRDVIIICVIILIGVLIYEIGIPLYQSWQCPHLNTRCIHGDEINQVSIGNRIRRQRCLDCGKALDRAAICTLTGLDVHEAHEPDVGQIIQKRKSTWFFRTFRS
jgi:hypothetical protein